MGKDVASLRRRKDFTADSLFSLAREHMASIADQRRGTPPISLPDALMSGLALFALKDPSLLAFEARRNDENLRSLFGIEKAPCDTQMRTILDDVEPDTLAPLFTSVFRRLQRGKVLERFRFLGRYYLLALDGTGYFSSEKIHCENCLTKVRRDGTVLYHHQLLGAAIVHPDHREVIPLMPEPIQKQDGQQKNDCERNAAKRLLARIRRDHPKLPLVVVEDALSSNAPHVRELKRLGFHFILGVKEGDHGFLFAAMRQKYRDGAAISVEQTDPQTGRTTAYTIVTDLPLNESNTDLKVTYIECFVEGEGDEPGTTFSWITDLPVTARDVVEVGRGGRGRWKIENEAFNTLKNQGYHFEHNFGHGERNLSVVFAVLMMLAFLIDQTQQLACRLFQEALAKAGSKRELWQRMRSLFYGYRVGSWADLWSALAFGFSRPRLPSRDTS